MPFPSSPIVEDVHALLCRPGDGVCTMKAIASAMNITDRTLRRRLADEGTSFSAISHQVKVRVAMRHLVASTASVEAVAELAGFSDASNFRRAFIRWTRMTPAQFRRQQQR